MTSFVELRLSMLDNPYYMAAWAIRKVDDPFPDGNILIPFFEHFGINDIVLGESRVTLQKGVQASSKEYPWWVWSLIYEQNFSDWLELVAWLIEVRERIDD